MRRALVAAVLLLAACGPANRYPDAYKLNFMQSCQLNGSSEAHCTCIWNRVEAEIPVADFEAADAALRAGASHPIAAQISAFDAACRAAP